jgi:CubicO group peptidase (beta-lactamase class C family)
VSCPPLPSPVKLPPSLPELQKALSAVSHPPSPAWQVGRRSLQGPLAQLEAQIDAVIQAAPDSPSVAVGLVYDQELVWSHGVGPVNRSDPSLGTVNAKTGFRIGSVTKVWTALMLRQLEEQGRVASGHDPVDKYEPRFRVQNPFEGSGPIRLNHLSSHMVTQSGTALTLDGAAEPITPNCG